MTAIRPLGLPIVAGAVLIACAGVAGSIACAGAAAPPAGSWLHPSFGAGQIEGETIVVLPVGAIAAVDGAVPSDSAAAWLAVRAGEALAATVEAGGAAGFAVRPVTAIVALGTMSADEVRTLYEPLTIALLDAAQGGEIPAGPAVLWRAVDERTEERFFLVPRSLTMARIEPLRVRATFDAWLVDAASAVVLWHADVSAVNPHAPSGAAADVYQAALQDAIDAAAFAVAERLSRLARTGFDDFGAAVP